VLVILCGLIPLAAAFSNIPTGERWLRRIAGWIVALAMYKLAAAFCYAAAFRLSAGTSVIAVMDGLALLVVSVLALPVLLRLTIPAAEHFALHRGAVASTRTAMGVMPTGAITLAAAGAGGAAVTATGAVEQRLAGATNGGDGGGPSGAGVGGGPAGRSEDGRSGARGSAGVPVPGASASSGGGGASGSDTAPGGSASPTGGEGSPGGGIPGATSTGFVPGTAECSDRDATGAGGRSAMPPSGAPQAGALPDGVERSHADLEVGGESPPGSAPPHSQSRPFQPRESSGGEDPTGTDEPWSGD
jgi:type IV secretion system protein TrbL